MKAAYISSTVEYLKDNRRAAQFLADAEPDLSLEVGTSLIRNGGPVEAEQMSDLHIQISPSRDAAVASYLLHVKTRSEKGAVTEEDNQETDVLFKRGDV